MLLTSQDLPLVIAMPSPIDNPIYTPPDILIMPGDCIKMVDVYVFKCPLCKNEFRHDDRYEPMCTGPNLSLDEHAPEVMLLSRIESRKQYVERTPGLRTELVG